MLKNLKIKNFKSIKQLDLQCKRLNLFIGEPNTGKSNILESIGIFSLGYEHDIKKLVRLENMTNLFFDSDINEPIEIKLDGRYYLIKFINNSFSFLAGKPVEMPQKQLEELPDQEKLLYLLEKQMGEHEIARFDYSGKLSSMSIQETPYKFYKFEVLNSFPNDTATFLEPPNGNNLLSILNTNKKLRKEVSEIFSDYGFRLVLKPQEKKIEILKEVDDIMISHPYSMVSDTLQRVIFYLVAIETNKDSVLIFEEPESHAFPFYTKFLAEKIALDETNQYFIATHNPYLLLPIIEKAPKEDIGVFITYFENYQTKVKALSEKELSQVIDLDASIFFNLDKFLGK